MAEMTRENASKVEIKGGLDEAITYLQDMQQKGQNVYIELGGHKLYSCDITVDGAYMEVLGTTKAENDAMEQKFNQAKTKEEEETVIEEWQEVIDKHQKGDETKEDKQEDKKEETTKEDIELELKNIQEELDSIYKSIDYNTTDFEGVGDVYTPQGPTAEQQARINELLERKKELQGKINEYTNGGDSQRKGEDKETPTEDKGDKITPTGDKGDKIIPAGDKKKTNRFKIFMKRVREFLTDKVGKPIKRFFNKVLGISDGEEQGLLEEPQKHSAKELIEFYRAESNEQEFDPERFYAQLSRSGYSEEELEAIKKGIEEPTAAEKYRRNQKVQLSPTEEVGKEAGTDQSKVNGKDKSKAPTEENLNNDGR